MKMWKQAYTTKFKELAVKQVKNDELGLGHQTLHNWAKASADGKFRGAGGKLVTSRRDVSNLIRNNQLTSKEFR